MRARLAGFSLFAQLLGELVGLLGEPLALLDQTFRRFGGRRAFLQPVQVRFLENR